MEVFEKIKFHRELKKFSQEFVGARLDLEQSQYSRRESGQIPFSINEVQKLSDLFEVEITELLQDNAVIFNNHNQTGGNFGQYLNVSDKLIEQYEARLVEKDEIITILKKRITDLGSR